MLSVHFQANQIEGKLYLNVNNNNTIHRQLDLSFWSICLHSLNILHQTSCASIKGRPFQLIFMITLIDLMQAEN